MLRNTGQCCKRKGTSGRLLLFFLSHTPFYSQYERGPTALPENQWLKEVREKRRPDVHAAATLRGLGLQSTVCTNSAVHWTFWADALPVIRAGRMHRAADSGAAATA